MDEVEVGLGENKYVIPVGFPVSDKVTPPVNPFDGVTVTVELPESPCCIVREVGDAAKEKSGLGGGGGARVIADAKLEEGPVPTELIAYTW